MKCYRWKFVICIVTILVVFFVFFYIKTYEKGKTESSIAFMEYNGKNYITTTLQYMTEPQKKIFSEYNLLDEEIETLVGEYLISFKFEEGNDIVPNAKCVYCYDYDRKHNDYNRIYMVRGICKFDILIMEYKGEFIYLMNEELL